MALSYNPNHFEDKWEPLMESYKEYQERRKQAYDYVYTRQIGQQSILNTPATSAPLTQATLREAYDRITKDKPAYTYTNSDRDAYHQHERITVLEEKLAMERKISAHLATALKKAEEEVAKNNVESLQALYAEVYSENQELRKRIQELEADLR